ncbi:hypothetical protein D9M73_270130 [compost metagenome]
MQEQFVEVDVSDLRGRDRHAQRRDDLPGLIAHRRGHRGNRRLEEAFAADKSALAVGLDHVEQLHHGLWRARRKLFQVIFRVEFAQLGQRQVFEQDAPEHGGVGGQARADVHRAGEH